MSTIIALIIGYLFGSIPFGYLLTKFSGMGDIRDIGSGNIGATNVLRTGNKKLAALTLLLDGVKGAVAVLIVEWIVPGMGAWAALAALLGHLFPVWLKFKGGKGVATSIGVITALVWPVGLIVMGVWLLVARLSHYSSLAALVSLGLAPFEVLLFSRYDLLWLTLAIVALVFWKHSANIKRLLNGTEPRIGAKI
jgi:glycerol-3-phosphate acyltransferase PlsY